METLVPHNPEKWFKWFILGICIWMLLILCSCDCNYHLSRIEKKCGKQVKDTLIVRDTVFSKSVDHDTTFYFNQKDTVIIKEGRLVMKYFYNDSTVYLKGECLTDTIYRVIKVPYEKNVYYYDYVKKYRWYIIIGILLILLVIVAKIIKK